VLAAIVLASNAFVAVPLMIYLGNVQEFSLSWPIVCLILLVPACGLFVLLAGLGLALPHAVRRLYAGALGICAILVWVQANLLVRDYGVINGLTPEWARHAAAGWVDGAVWLLLTLVGIVLIIRDRTQVVTTAAWILCLSQFLVLALDISGAGGAAPESAHSADGSHAMHEFSSERNVVHIVVDGFQSDVFQDLLEAEEIGARIRRELSGFVYYPETLGVFPYTQFAVPAFLAGRVYKNDTVKEDFIDSVLREHSIIGIARQNGYEVGIAMEGRYLYRRYMQVPHDVIVDIDRLGKADPAILETAVMLDLALFRMVPHGLKPLVFNDQKWVLQSLFAREEAYQFKYFQDTRFLKELTTGLSVTRPAPVYKYIHVMNSHAPMVVNRDCGYAGRVLPNSRKTLTDQSRCTLETLLALFDAMKVAGIYDESLIIIHADHGGWVPNRRRGRPIRFSDGTPAAPWIASLASPLLAIKLPGAGQALEVSAVQASLLDIPDTLSDILGFGVRFGSDSLLDLASGEVRQRRFYFYPWQDGEWHQPYTAPIQEFIVMGSHYEATWVADRIFWPEGRPP
jgi:hypothetical protein